MSLITLKGEEDGRKGCLRKREIHKGGNVRFKRGEYENNYLNTISKNKTEE